MTRRVRLEMFEHLRQRVVAHPRLIACARDVAVGVVDREGRVPRDLVRDHRVEHGGEPRRIGLSPEVAGPAEAVEFVVVVVRLGPVLPATDGGVGNAVPVLDGAHAPACRIEGVGVLDLHVGGNRKSLRAGFLGDGLPDVGIVDEDLEAGGALGLEGADERARLGRRRGASGGVRDDGRRVDAVFVRELGVRDHGVDAVHRARFTHRGDAVCEPELVDVVLGQRLAAARELDVPVHVDDAGHHEESGTVDGAIGRPLCGCVGDGAPGELLVAALLDADDLAVLDGEVERTAQRIPHAVDHRDVGDEQTSHLLADGRRGGLRDERDRCEEAGDEGERAAQDGGHGDPGEVMDGA